ncbi:imelysin family protein [Agaribacterium haliotis]|uniref:imelysin family protein n=1 Tax=Agaribacterium haliotis TaxID=2013869 RepID=UPI0013041FAD|nr:imelysin family protein [Agaribacterium haliotis]
MKQLYIVIALSFAFILSACEKQEQQKQTQVTQTELNLDSANSTLWASFAAAAQQALLRAEFLQSAIDALLQNSDQAHLVAAQQAWRDAEQSFLQLSLLEQLSLVEATAFGPVQLRLYDVAAQPIQPGYLDRFGPYPYSGLVYDIGVELNEPQLRNQHGLTDREEVVLGLYAIEFMLFGEEQKRGSEDYRAYTELDQQMLEQQFSSVDELPSMRRRQLLKLQASLLVKDCQRLEQSLSKQEQSRASWQLLTPQQQVQSIRTAISAGLTQTLLALGQLQQQLSNTEDSEAQQALFAAFQSQVSKVQSFNAALAFYSNPEYDALAQVIKQSQSQLQAEHMQSLDAEQQKQVLSAFYKQLKSLI